MARKVRSLTYINFAGNIVLPVELDVRVRELEKQYGGLRAAARALKCDAAYLLRLRNGAKHNPSDATLHKLGLEKITAYVRKEKNS
jgi:hypothetical protein